MKAGGIGVITTAGGSPTIDTSSFPLTKSDGKHDLRSTIEEEWSQQALDGTMLNRGRAAMETTEQIKTTRLTADGQIEDGLEKTEIATYATNFLRVPGEFVVTETTKDDFAYELLKEATGETILPASIDLSSFLDEMPDAEPWMGWFRGNGGPLSAGSAYGNINSAPDMARYIRDHQNTQLGLKNVSFNGRLLKLVISRSGWVAVYEPKDMDTVEFAQFIREKVQPHSRVDR